MSVSCDVCVFYTDSDAGFTAVMPAVSLCCRAAVSPGSDSSNPAQLSPHEVLPAHDETAAGTHQTPASHQVIKPVMCVLF